MLMMIGFVRGLPAEVMAYSHGGDAVEKWQVNLHRNR
jgi:hypothetical protein